LPDERAGPERGLRNQVLYEWAAGLERLPCIIVRSKKCFLEAAPAFLVMCSYGQISIRQADLIFLVQM
jgi:hypothetical protein